MFINEAHEEAFCTFLEEAYLDVDMLMKGTWEGLDSTLRRQLAFLYMVSYYQQDYKDYEGESFYVEAFEELEIGGPVYLLEEEVHLRTECPHEWVLHFAKPLIRGERVVDEQVDNIDEIMQELYTKALTIANISSVK
ncbi:MAG: hypothetical protein ACRDDX_15480 [Cellulosilyticaceae bacterium]